MKQYEYVHLVIDKFMLGAQLTEHRRIIADWAGRGYRYIGWIPTNIDRSGVIFGLDLVFERDSSDAAYWDKENGKK